MIFRQAVQNDLEEVAKDSISRGPKENPVAVDFISALEHEGKVLAVGGIRMMNATTAWAWFNMSVHARAHIRSVYRVVSEWMDVLAKTHGIRRMMAAVEPDFPEAIRTVEHLGFQQESVMANFFGDKFGYLFVRFYPAGGV